MTNSHVRQRPCMVEPVTRIKATPSERRQQLAEQIGRLLARIWIRRRGQSQTDSIPTDLASDPSAAG